MQFSIEKAWHIAPKIPVEEITKFNGYSEVMAQLLFNRGYSDAYSADSFLNDGGEFFDPFLLLDMEKTVAIILSAIDAGDQIAVYGDYDVDGISATALMTQVLSCFGARVTAYIPDRFSEGYGVNTNALEKLRSAGIALIITVDCGIRSINELTYATHELGLKVIVSDHHGPLEVLPLVDAIVCQKRAEDIYPEKNLSGVGLAFKIAQALFQMRPIEGIDVRDWLDLAALGTVADVVPLVGENRTIVKQGLVRMRICKRVGLTALINVARLKMGALSAMDISFGIAPRLNAVGRLESIQNEIEDFSQISSELSLPISAQKALSILMTDDFQIAGLLAQELDDLNRKRQQLTRDMQSRAEQLINDEDLLLFAADQEFNSGLVGLVAAKLTEFYYRPTIIGFMGTEKTRASCRSIPEFHITEALDRCQDLLLQHGGHAMAAGFTVANENLPLLIERLQQIANEKLNQENVQPGLQVDIDIPLRNVPKDILLDLDRLEPIGSGNPPAIFVSRNVSVIYAKTVGSDKSHLKLTLQDGKDRYDAIAFRQGYWEKALPNQIDILYQIDRNFFNGKITTQLNIKDIKASQ